MGKLATALWKGAKHAITAGLGAGAAALLSGASLKQVGLTALGAALAGIGINVPAIRAAK